MSIPDFSVVIENRFIGRNLFIIEMYSRVVHLRMLLLQQSDNLCASPYRRTIAMSSHHMNRTIGIESSIETHAGTDTDILHLSFVIDRLVDSLPTQQCCGTVCLGIYPSMIDGMGYAVGIDSCC